MSEGRKTQEKAAILESIQLHDATKVLVEEKKLTKYSPENTPWGDLTDEYNADGQYAMENGWIDITGQLLQAGQEEQDSRIRTAKDMAKADYYEFKKKETDQLINEREREFKKKRRQLLELLNAYFQSKQTYPEKFLLRIRKTANDHYFLAVYDESGKIKKYSTKGKNQIELVDQAITHFQSLMK